MTQQKRLAPRLVLNDLSGFDAHEYSQFKYGDTRPAVEYAEEIYRHCLQGQIQSTEVDVVFSPNTYLPTAAHSIAEELISILSSAGHDCQDVNVHRQTTYTKDYGKMNAQERANMISGDTYGFKNQPRKDATMVFVDDVSITRHSPTYFGAAHGEIWASEPSKTRLLWGEGRPSDTRLHRVYAQPSRHKLT